MTNTRFFLQCVAQLYYKTLHGVTVHGADKLPLSGPYIIASNHISNHDPVILAAFLDDSIKFMAKEELFRFPVLRTVIKRLDAFPVRRSGIGIGGIRHAIRLLKMGQTVGIFPEGTRSRDGRPLPYKSGVGFIATKVNPVPIVPIAICAEQNGKLLKRFHIAVGEPIIPVRTDYRWLAQHVMQTIYALKRAIDYNSARCVAEQESIE